VINSFAAYIAILDAAGLILVTERARRRFAAENAAAGSDRVRGANYQAISDAAEGLVQGMRTMLPTASGRR